MGLTSPFLALFRLYSLFRVLESEVMVPLNLRGSEILIDYICFYLLFLLEVDLFFSSNFELKFGRVV